MKYSNISMMKTTALLCVILSHCLLFFVERNPFWMLYAPESSHFVTVFYNGLSYFIIPAFVFASGFLLAKSLDNSSRTIPQLILHRSKRVLLPWLCVGLFWMVPLYTLFQIPVYNHPADATLLAGYRLFFSGVFNDHLWFLLILFWSTLFWLLLARLTKKNRLVVGFLVAVIAALLVQNLLPNIKNYCLNQVSLPILSMFAGIVMYHYKDLTTRLRRFLPVISVALFVVLALLLWYQSANVYVQWLVSLLGCFFLYLAFHFIAAKLYEPLRTCKPYRWFEDNSMAYYLLHMPFPFLVFKGLSAIADLSTPVFICINFILTLLLTTVVVWVVKAAGKKINGLRAR